MPTIMNKLSSAPTDPENITLLTVSADQNDERTLHEFLAKDRWTVQSAGTCGEALRAVEKKPPTVVACERQLPDGTWKDLFQLLYSLENPPPVIVVSKHADESLWAEVLNLGGYDVLAKPFEPTEVSRVLGMARRFGRRQGATGAALKAG